jgi:hypothetical protein
MSTAFGVFLLLIGSVMLIWHRRLARAYNAGTAAAIEALRDRWLKSLWDANRVWAEPFYRFGLVLMGLFFVATGILALVV